MKLMSQKTVLAMLGLPGLVVALAAQSWALTVPQVTHDATMQECSACHMVFPPQMLPARSWEALMGDLGNHFGEDASLADPVKSDITAYLTANAADSPQVAGAMRGVLRGIKATDTPLRITETPWWKRAHGEVSKAAYARPKVKSAANCIACHQGSDKGVFREPGD